MKKKIDAGCSAESENAISEEIEEMSEETAADKEKTGAHVYCGPSVRNVIRQYTVYSGAIPDSVKAFLDAHPTAKALMVPLDRFAETRKNLETKGSAEAVLYNKVKSEM